MTAPRWDRTSAGIVGVFSPPASLYWMHRQLTYVLNVLDAWVRGLETMEQDPTAATLGMVHVRGRPDYPPLRRPWPSISVRTPRRLCSDGGSPM